MNVVERAVWGAAVWGCLLVQTGCGSPAERAQAAFDSGAEAVLEGDLDTGIAAYEAGLELAPASPVGLNLLGMAYRMKYNALRDDAWKDQEIETFRAAVAADSTYWPALINLGATLYYMGDRTEAAPYFQKALELHPENPERERLEAMIREGSDVGTTGR